MRRSRLYAWCFSAGLGLVGCGSEATNGAVMPEGSRPVLVGSSKRFEGGNGCGLVAVAQLPLRPSDISVVGTGPYDMVSTAFVDAGGGITAIYEAYADFDLTSGSLKAATSRDCGKTYGAPKVVNVGPAVNYRTTPSAVRVGQRKYLYFASADSFNGPSTIFRSQFEGGDFGDAEEVGPLGGVSSLFSWPRFVEAPVGIAVAYRTSVDRVASLALSFDGRSFSAPITVNDGQSAMVRTAFFRSGVAISTYQTHSADGMRFWSWLRILSGGQVWTAPMLVTTNSENVHDTVPFLRNDGEIDLYYIHSTLAPTDTFRLYRRSLTQQGVLGPEELVTDIGSPNKPNLARLPDGKVLLMFADITKVDPTGYPTEQQLKTAVLSGDAPRS